MYKIVLIFLLILKLSRLTAAEIQIVSESVCYGDSTNIRVSADIADSSLQDIDWDLDNDGFYDDAHGRYVKSLFPSGITEIGVQLTTKDGKTYFSDYAQIVVFEKPKSGFYTKNLCQGKDAAFICDSSSYRVFWNFDNDKKYLEGSEVKYNFTNSGLHSVSMKMTDQHGCVDSIQQTVEIKELPTMQLKVENVACYTFKFTGTEDVNTLIWMLGDSTLELNLPTLQHTYAKDGIFTVNEIIITNKGCRDTMGYEVFLPPKPDVTIHSVNDTIEDNTEMTLTAITDNTGASYQWNTGSITDTIIISKAGTYSVYASNASGCTDTAQVTIYQKQQPIIPEVNADILFTPNNDGINDLLVIPGWESCTNCHLTIFSADGKLILNQNNYLGNWDGRFNGSGISSGAYYFVLKKDSKIVIKGSINVLK
jgi:gliding motility-associated-like protein